MVSRASPSTPYLQFLALTLSDEDHPEARGGGHGDGLPLFAERLHHVIRRGQLDRLTTGGTRRRGCERGGGGRHRRATLRVPEVV